jgi:hypothetical protein
MFGPQRIAGIVIAGVIIGGGGVGLAAPAYAAPCDAMQQSMSPHVGTTCQDPAFAAPAPVAPAAEDFSSEAASPEAPAPEMEPALGPQDNTQGAQAAELAPPQAVAADGSLSEDPALQPGAGDFDLPATG